MSARSVVLGYFRPVLGLVFLLCSIGLVLPATENRKLFLTRQWFGALGAWVFCVLLFALDRWVARPSAKQAYWLLSRLGIPGDDYDPVRGFWSARR